MRSESESPSDDIEVIISKGGEQIRVVDTSNGSVVVRLPSGAYEVALKDHDQFMITKGQNVVIKRGADVRVSIRPKPSSTSDAQAATAAATAWLNLLDSGSFDDCYDQTSPKMRQMVSKSVFVQAIQGALKPLGVCLATPPKEALAQKCDRPSQSDSLIAS